MLFVSYDLRCQRVQLINGECASSLGLWVLLENMRKSQVRLLERHAPSQCSEGQGL